MQLALDVLGKDRIKSVVDFGCGTGQWLAVFREKGCEVTGFDSDRVDASSLVIPKECFSAADLTRAVHLDRKYDLAMSIEVAEHLDEQYADTFIDTVTRASGIVLFSAAVPHQDGTHHVNCQWQSYWIKKFSDRGYAVLDCIRPLVWGNEDAQWWHRENVLLFCKDGEAKYAPLLRLAEESKRGYYDVVHPGHWEYMYEIVQDLRRRNERLEATMRNSTPMRIASWFCGNKVLHSIYAHTIRPLIKRGK